MKNEVKLDIKKYEVFKGIGSSFIYVTVLIHFHCDVSGLVDCPVCNRKSYEYIASVDNIKINKINPKNSITEFEKSITLEHLEIRVEQALKGITSCFLNRELDELHEVYIENLFSGQYRLENITFC